MSPSTPSAVLLWGEDPFLLRDATLAVLGEARATTVDSSEWEGGETSLLATPSLFGDQRALVVTGCKQLSTDALKELDEYLASPAPDALLILVAQVGDRARLPAALAKLAKARAEVREVAVARKELGRWVVERAKGKGLSVRPDVAAALVEVLGEAPAVLDGALDQLASAYAGQTLTRETVLTQFRGLGEQRLWDLCDRAFGKDVAGSTRSLGSLLESREDPLAILGGIASRLRDLLRVKSLPDRAPPAEVAKAAGLRFDWQARRYKEQARRFTMTELVRLHSQVAEADRVMKSGAPGDIVLPTLVAAIAAPEGS